MILVTIGTSEPFDRLLRALGSMGLEEELVVQHGVSSLRVPRARCIDFVPFEELVSLIRSARVVVMHAGAGSVIAALATGKRPVVVPRRRAFGEAVDDHQVPFARRLHDAGLVVLVEDPDDLGAALANGISVTPVEEAVTSELTEDLRAYLADVVGRPPGLAGRT